MKRRHYNIPIFIPEEACPNQCVFCNQQHISGVASVPQPNEISEIVDKYISTIDYVKSDVEVAFFGGSFTGLPKSSQVAYLKAVQPYIKQGKIKRIRISTRPDYITEDILDMLRKYHVGCIELGAQSTDDFVLEKSGRGHDAEAIFNAAKMIKRHRFELGLQMMIGLPGDTLEKALQTARDFISLHADNTRIYPTLVIKDTELAAQYSTNEYQPVSLKTAVIWSAILLELFVENNIKVLRVGLHPSKDLIEGKGYLAGPFHPSFRELVLTEIWNKKLMKIEAKEKSSLVLRIPHSQLNYAIGYKGFNKKGLLRRFKSVQYIPDNTLTSYQYHAVNN